MPAEGNREAQVSGSESNPIARRARSLFDSLAKDLGAPGNMPLATYRLQFHKGFRFEQARGLVPYLDRLGITHVYASPYLKAAPGSSHGYDVVDYNQINPEIGTPEEHEAFCASLSARGLGQILDFVPNHMGIERDNAMWNDVLENGPASMYAKYFDIDWAPVKEELRDKVLLPVLGDQYGVVLERGELGLAFVDGTFEVHYYDRVWPVVPRQYSALLSHRIEELEKQLGSAHPHLVELQSILTAIEHLPRRTETERAKLIERNREKEVIKRRLSALAGKSEALRSFIQKNVKIFNGRPKDPRSFDSLDSVLANCSYRLAHWRVAGEEINYRRFFDINALAAIRVEDPDVFQDVHGLVFRLISEGKITGLRIDHPDGLFDPTAYFLHLQESYVVEQARRRLASEGLEPEKWGELEKEIRRLFSEEVAANPESPIARSLYVVVEKIQGGRERIPDAWAIAGNTGYRFANVVGGLFVERDSERLLTDTYERFIGQRPDYRALLYEKKKLIMSVSMASEINVLARELNRISEMNRRTRDFTLDSLRRALVEFIALFPVYRTYVDGLRPEVDDRDIQYVEWTIARAKQSDPTTNVTIFDFLQDILLRRYPKDLNEQEREVMLRFAMRVQQLTGPVMAKALEDTVFYIYNRLISLNEVGGEPERFGTSEETFHLRNQERAERWPGSFLATSTHDTKRGEDVRARINVITELPAEWRAGVRRWARLNRRHKLDGSPEPNDEYLLYQTLLGAWPMGGPLEGEAFSDFRERIVQYMLKAIREAKVITSWVNPDPVYESAMAHFVRAILDRAGNRTFVEDFECFKQLVERPGQVNALVQVLLKIASPGVTDIYQGCELWNLSLVDPDNRRPVDFDLRAHLLEQLDREAEIDRLALCQRLYADMTDGRAKLFALCQGLRLRRRRKALFGSGEYLPLGCSGTKAGRAISFARRLQDQLVVAIAPRRVASFLESGGIAASLRDTFVHLPAGISGEPLKDVFTGRILKAQERQGSAVLSIGEALEVFPLALLERVNE
jgi:(1->4)-alpha-D-glucan 1-alpha-D-glucosylmutase